MKNFNGGGNELLSYREKMIRERCECELSVRERIESNVLKWSRHVEGMREERLVKRVYRANVEGNSWRGRPQRRWRDEVKDLLLGRSLSQREGMIVTRDQDA